MNLRKGIIRLINLHREIAVVFFGYLFLCIWFFGKNFLNEYISGDLLAYTIPTHFFVFKSIKEGFIPLWQPYSYLGLPLLFNPAGAFMYPILWLVYLFNLLVNYSSSVNLFGKTIELFLYFHILLGAMGMYAFLRKKINLSWTSSFFGGFIFSFSLFTTSNLGGNISVLLSLVYFPIIIYFLLSFIEKNSFRNFLLLVAVHLLLFTFFYPYFMIYFIYAEIGLSLIFGIKIFFRFSISLITSFLLSSLFTLPEFYVSSQAYRILGETLDPQFHTRFAAFPTYIINILIPQGIYSGGLLTWGIIPLIFLITGFIGLKMNKVNIWLMLIFVFSILFALGGYINLQDLLGIPPFFIDKLRSHGQILILAFFSGIVILSQGVDDALNGKGNRIVEFCVLGFLGILLTFMLFLPILNVNYMKDFKETLILIGRVIIFLGIGLLIYRLLYRYKKKIFVFTILVLTLFEFHIYYSNLEYIRMGTSYRKYLQRNSLIPEIPSENNLFRNFFSEDQFAYNVSYLKVFGFQGYEGTPYAAFYDTARFKMPERLQFANVKYVIGITPASPDSNYKLLFSVNPSTSPNETFVSSAPGLSGWTPKSQNTHYVYELKNYLPRFYVPEIVQSCQDDDCYNKEEVRKLVYVSEKGIRIINPQQQKVKLKIIFYNPNKIKIDVNTPKETFIASSEIWDQGWEIKINGIKSQIYNVSDGFRGFKVSKGRSIVEMYYVPPYFYFGLIMSFIGCLFIILLCKINFFKNEKLELD